MLDHLTIDAAYSGPPDSGNGGYVCGVTAAQLVADPAADVVIEVTLRLPPPLGRPLRVERVDDAVQLLDDGRLVARAVRGELDLVIPVAPTRRAVEEATSSFDVDDYRSHHPFGRCFVCGPERAVGNGLRIFPGSSTDRPDLAVWPWATEATYADAGGQLRGELIWAALDCPSAFGYWMANGMATPIVLGRLTAQIRRRPTPHEPLIVGGWLVGQDGRKVTGGSVVWDADGSVVAVAKGTWIELRQEQAAAFTGRHV